MKKEGKMKQEMDGGGQVRAVPRTQNETPSNERKKKSSPFATSRYANPKNSDDASTGLMASQENVDIIGILNSPGTTGAVTGTGTGTTSETPSRSVAPLLPLVGTPGQHTDAQSQALSTPDRRTTELLDSQKQVSYSSIACVDFPAIEVTIDSGSSDSHHSSNAQLSPLTPYYASSSSQKRMPSRSKNGSGRNLVNVLKKVTSKQSKQRKAFNGGLSDKNMDVDDNDRYADMNMGKSRTAYDRNGTPRNQSDSINGNMDPLDLSVDPSSSSDDGIDSTTTPLIRNNRYDRRKKQQTKHHQHNDINGNGEKAVDRKHRPKLNRIVSTGSYGTTNSHQQQKRQPSYKPPRKVREAPTLHAQTFVLSLAFFALWSPQNLMAPNLTQMAEYFHFSPGQRDLFLGANIAFATGVLSLPVSALLGFLADVVASRKRLYAGTVLASGFASICTGLSETYAQLYFARFVCGGFMAGAVPIAFSLLGDLFDAKDRNAASSGLTAMMGAGILAGQVFSGMIGDKVGWKQPFYYSGIMSIVTSLMVMVFVREPVRGGKEKVLQEMIANGTKYDRKLTLEGFLHAMTKNKTNVILMLQGFFTSIPWGILFTFMNDYLSQEQGFSVPASTFLVLWFGLGMAAGGILGGWIGAICMRTNRSLLPIFMAVSTLVGIVPFLGLLDLKFHGASFFAVFLAFTGGCVASLPSVNVRPCLLNVNPPETRGAAMTAANLIINVARGAGPSLITLPQSFGYSRQYSFNMTIIVFWTITTIFLLVLAKTLPDDQDRMDAELARYAALMLKAKEEDEEKGSYTDISSLRVEDMLEMGENDSFSVAGNESIISIEDRMTSFDAAAAQESWSFIEGALREIAELSHIRSRYESVDDVDTDDGVWDSQDAMDGEGEELNDSDHHITDKSGTGIGSSAAF